jgi:RNA-binding protein
MALTGQQKRYLRGLAHHRDAIVQVGHQGVTDALLVALDQALEDHELVKVRLAQAVEDRDEAAEALTQGAKAQLVQQMGRTVVLYRRRPKNPKIELPKPGARQAAAAKAAKKAPKPAPRRPAVVADEDDEDLEDDDAFDDEEEGPNPDATEGGPAGSDDA